MSAATNLTREYVIGDFFPESLLPAVIAQQPLRSIVTDSRKVEVGAVYCLLPSISGDDHVYIHDAIHRGASVIVSEKTHSEIKDLIRDASVATIVSSDIYMTTANLLNQFHGSPSKALSVVGITGTNGKTSCADMLAQCWKFLGQSAATIGTLGKSVQRGIYFDTGHTTMDIAGNIDFCAECVDGGISHVAMEVSSHGIAQRRIEGTFFATKVLTNITRDHLDFHGSMDAYASTKLGFLSDSSARLVVNIDDERVRAWVQQNPLVSVLRYGFAEDADVRVTNCVFGVSGIRATIVSPWGEGILEVPLIGRFNVHNMLAVLSVLCGEGETLANVLASLANVQCVPGRLERIKCISGSNTADAIFIDYAHTPDALEKVLQALHEHDQKNIIGVFGCGGDRDKGKRSLMAGVAEKYCEQVVVTTDNPRYESPSDIIRDIQEGFTSDARVEVIEDRIAAIKYALDTANPNNVVLIAGKGHECYQEIAGKKVPYSDGDTVRKLLSC